MANKRHSHPATRALAVFGTTAAAIYTARVLLDLFGPAIPYTMKNRPAESIDSEDFVHFLSLVTDAAVRDCSRITLLRNGAQFYPAELDAVRGARQTISLEFYEFLDGSVAREMVQALTKKARSGVTVRMVIDALGSFHTQFAHLFDELIAAGGQLCWYHPIRWDTWPRLNNRTHRKLLIADGEIGFIGGAGVADHWLKSTSKVPCWRDTVFRVEGAAVSGLVSAFAENWLEASGEILSDPVQFKAADLPPGQPSLIVSSTPKAGGTRNRILLQALLNSACKTIRITTPYFLPDKSAREALVRAVNRGVKVEILVAGPHIDHPIVRRISHHSSKRLLRAGAVIYEYQPAMLHAKLMTIDSVWSVVGSTNFDHRSFALNDEVNLATMDRELAERIERDFYADLEQSRRLTLAMLHERTIYGQITEVAGTLLEREE